jgi:hypothetical protein
MSGRNTGLQALVRKKILNIIISTSCMFYIRALASTNMCEKLQTVYEAAIRIVDYVKNCPLRVRLFAKLCDDNDAQHTALLLCCETLCLSSAKVLHRVFELEREIVILYVMVQIYVTVKILLRRWHIW